jgi:hypothetical protein
MPGYFSIEFRNAVEEPLRVQPKSLHFEEWKFLLERQSYGADGVNSHGAVKHRLTFSLRLGNSFSIVGQGAVIRLNKTARVNSRNMPTSRW